MEFHEKLQKLRAAEGLTQEELAEQLYVSRAAVSKWESGRGYPGIDSLKAIAKHFHVTIDELICGEEVVTLAEEDLRASRRRYTALICGLLDCLTVLLFFLPVFGNGEGGASALPGLTGIRLWLKVLFFVVVGLTAANGFCAVVISGLDKPVWDKHRLITGLALSILGTVLFILTRQPYAAILYLCLLAAKGLLALKRR